MGEGTRTPDIQIHSLTAASRNPKPANTSGDAAAPHVPQHVPAGPEDADLARVVAAWPELPEAIRRAVLALIGSAG